MSRTAAPEAPRRGRPIGGGNEPEKAKEAILDAAERSIAERGYRASTMAVIAREAGYTRTIMYRHFATRDDLVDALLKRSTLRQIDKVKQRLGPDPDLSDLVVESCVMVATELVHDPMFAVFAERTEAGAVAHLIANAGQYIEFVESLIGELVGGRTGFLREGLRHGDAAQFLVISAMSLLLGLVPGSEDPDQVRRYMQVFVLPAVMAEPPGPGPVFRPV